MNRHDGERWLSAQRHRAAAGLATHKQLKLMARYGVNNPQLSKARASAVINYILGKKGRDLSPQAIDAIINFKREPGDES